MLGIELNLQHLTYLYPVTCDAYTPGFNDIYTPLLGETQEECATMLDYELQYKIYLYKVQRNAWG